MFGNIMEQKELQKLLEIGVLLSSERDSNRLLEKILACVMELTHCDAGTLYLLDKDVLRFKIMRNNTLGTYSGGDGENPGLPPVPLNQGNVCALSLMENRIIRIADVYNCPGQDFSGPKKYDAQTGYHTQSMLVVPMSNRKGEKLGVLQLINALDEEGKICPFSPEMTLILESIASQAAITIQNVRYLHDIRELFSSFVRVMSTAIDQLTPYNASHSRRMAACGDLFLDYLNSRLPEKERFSAAHKEEILMSIWLHDIGKLITPLSVMNKQERLLPEQKTAFAHRMEVIRLRSEIDCLKGRLTQEQLEELLSKTEKAEKLVAEISNASQALTDSQLAKIHDLAGQTYLGKDNSPLPWLKPSEEAMLSIRRGTLSEEERRIMKAHVTLTDSLLSQIHFSKEFSHVREWAGSHHELLDGSGYPKGLSKDAIPREVRIITILDVFDALVADDRPYKPGMPIPKALSILEKDAENGKLDARLVRQFAESHCWENVYQTFTGHSARNQDLHNYHNQENRNQ